MQKLTTEAQRTQSCRLEIFLGGRCASVVRNLHHKTGKQGSYFRHIPSVELVPALTIAPRDAVVRHDAPCDYDHKTPSNLSLTEYFICAGVARSDWKTPAIDSRMRNS